jgi:hypothetical protein
MAAATDFEGRPPIMADRNRSDLDREQRGSSNPNQTERTEERSTSSRESGMGNTSRNPNQGTESVGNESEDRSRDNVGSSSEGNRPTSIEGGENPDRR